MSPATWPLLGDRARIWSARSGGVDFPKIYSKLLRGIDAHFRSRAGYLSNLFCHQLGTPKSVESVFDCIIQSKSSGIILIEVKFGSIEIYWIAILIGGSIRKGWAPSLYNDVGPHTEGTKEKEEP